MGIERIPEDKNIPDYNALCPECGNRTVFIHDLRCSQCDNRTVVWCPACEAHFKVTLN